MPSGGNHTDDSSPTNGIERRKWLEVLGVAGAAGLAGCSGGGGTDTDTQTETDAGGGFDDTPEPTDTPMEELPEVGGSYTNAIANPLSTLNAMYNTEATAGTRIGYTLDGAYGFRPGQELVPRWIDMSTEDGRVWTAELRENLQWGAGYGQMTSEDWVYMIKQLHQTDWSGTAASTDWYIGGDPIPVEKVDKYTFEVQLPEVDPAWHKKPIMWGAQCAPKGLLQPYVEDEDSDGLQQDEELLNLEYSGNLGAYNLEEWSRQDSLTFTRSDDYYMREIAENGDAKRAYEKAPYFDQLVTQVIQEESSRLSALRTGEIDTAGVPPAQAQQFGDRDDVYLNVTPQPYISKIAYNMRSNGWEPFRKRKVRQGLACALNKQQLVEGVYRGYAEPAFTYQPRWSPFYDDSQVQTFGTGDLYGSDPARSRISEGISGTEYEYQGDQLVDGNGEQVELGLIYSPGSDTQQTTAQYIAQEFQQNAGIQVSLEGIPGAQFDADYARNSAPEGSDPEWNVGPYNGGPRDVSTGANPWDMSIIYGFNTYPMTPTACDTFFLPDGGINYYGYEPSFDFESLVQEAATSTGDAREEALAEMFGKLAADQPFGFTVMSSDIIGYRQGIEGPIESFFSGWDFGTWYRDA